LWFFFWSQRSSAFCDDFSEKKKSSLAAADVAGDIDESRSHLASLDSAALSNASGIIQSADGQTLDSSAENAPAANHFSSKDKQKTKSAKSRPTCVLCNKSFHTRYKLNEHHAVVHLDKRLFSCNVCQKTFGRADHLIRHVRNRVCFPRQQLPELVDTSGRPGNSG